jgi:hypothetical protein
MATPASRQDLIDYCFRQLGDPVIEINVDPDQAEERIDEALQFYQEYHSDATKKMFIPHTITADDVTNKFITVADSVIFVERILPIAEDAGFNMFDVKYQMHLNDVYQLGNLGNLAYYEMVQQNLAMYDMKIGSGASELIRWARHENKIYLDVGEEDLKVGSIIIVAATMHIAPYDGAAGSTSIWNDMFLKRYSTALIKKQWGANLIKFEGMQLPGGVTINGRQIYEDAMQDLEKLEEQVRLTHELPVNFFMG